MHLTSYREENKGRVAQFASQAAATNHSIQPLPFRKNDALASESQGFRIFVLIGMTSVCGDVTEARPRVPQKINKQQGNFALAMLV